MVDIGEFSSFRVNPMKVHVQRCLLEGVGGLTIIEAQALCGIMKMKTLVLTPSHRELVLFSWDLIQVMGRNTLLLDFYDFPVRDTQPDYAKQKEIKHSLQDLGPYKRPAYDWLNSYLKNDLAVAVKGIKKDFPRLEQTMEESLTAYLQTAQDAAILTDEEKTQKRAQISRYVDKLFDLGSPTTKVFKKSMGEEKARAFYHDVMFCP